VRTNPRRASLATLLLFLASGCVNSPIYSHDELANLARARAAGVPDRIDLPKSTALALGLGFVFPCAGQFYAGDWIDGLKVLCTFWLGVPWVKGIIDGYREARWRNDMAILEAWEQEKSASPQRETAEGTTPPDAERPAAAEKRDEARPTGKRFCGNCGNELAGGEKFCTGCGARR
jgi:TM2 domain-containing membrane protein YozV